MTRSITKFSCRPQTREFSSESLDESFAESNLSGEKPVPNTTPMLDNPPPICILNDEERSQVAKVPKASIQTSINKKSTSERPTTSDLTMRRGLSTASPLLKAMRRNFVSDTQMSQKETMSKVGIVVDRVKEIGLTSPYTRDK